LALVLGGLAAVDALTALPSSAPRPEHETPGLRPGRAFVLVIDSLR
jgi:hypothetical protein